MITRVLEESIRNKLGQDKAIVIMGARQVGKTTLLKHLFKEKEGILWLNGDEQDTRALFENIFNLFYWLSYYLIFCLLLFSDNIKTSWFLRSLPRKNHSVEYLRKFSEVYIVF